MRWFIFLIIGCLTCLPCAAAEVAGEAASSSPTLWTWEAGLVTAGFAGALAAALEHDVAWYQSVQEHRSPAQDLLVSRLSLLGDGYVQVALSAGLYQFGSPRDRRVALAALEGQAAVAVASVLLKSALRATRPETNPRERTWFAELEDDSFPSGHTMSAFCAAAVFGHAYHLEWLTFPLATLVGYSRIYNQRHWPADVVAGAGVGTLLGYWIVTWNAPWSPEGPRWSVRPAETGSCLVVSWSF